MAFEATDRNELRSKLEEYANTGDKVLRDEIVASQVGLAEYLARRFKNRGEPIEDLIQVALLGLLKAVERFDPSRGLEFSTFATPTIVGELKRHFRDGCRSSTCGWGPWSTACPRSSAAPPPSPRSPSAPRCRSTRCSKRWKPAGPTGSAPSTRRRARTRIGPRARRRDNWARTTPVS